MADRSRLTLDVRQGERVNVGDDITIELVHKSGQSARLLVLAPREITIWRDATSKTHECSGAAVVPSTAP